MAFQKVLHDLDSLSEELGIITKQNYEFILANLNWEKGANNELTQFGCKLSNLYSFSMQNGKNIELAETIPTIVDNLLSNLNKGSLTLLEETLLSQFRKLFLDQIYEFFSGIDMIAERIGHLKGLITSQIKGHCDPVVMHYLERGNAGQQHILKLMLELLYPDGYDSISTPLRKVMDTEIVSSSTTCDLVTVTDEPKNDSSIADLHVQSKHFDTGSESIICTPKATDTEILSSSTTCDSVTVTDEPKYDSSITDSHVQSKHFDTGSESIICTPKATDTEILSSSTTCDSVTVTDEPKYDSSTTDSHVQRKHFDTGSKSIICTPKATDSHDTEIVSSSTSYDSVTVTDKPKNDSSITDSHVQRKYVKRGSKYKSKANWKYGTSQKLKFPRVNKRISKPMKTSKGANKNKSTSKIKIGYIHKSNLNYFSNAMTFYNRLLLKRPKVKFKDKLH